MRNSHSQVTLSRPQPSLRCPSPDLDGDVDEPESPLVEPLTPLSPPASSSPSRRVHYRGSVSTVSDLVEELSLEPYQRWSADRRLGLTLEQRVQREFERRNNNEAREMSEIILKVPPSPECGLADNDTEDDFVDDFSATRRISSLSRARDGLGSSPKMHAHGWLHAHSDSPDSDALIAHKVTWEQHRVPHRYVNAANNLVYEGDPGSSSVPVGRLSDWDLAKAGEEALEPRPSQPFRSGTWQFMSAARQWLPWKPHVLADDLESFMHILNWLALIYMKHKMSGNPAMLLHCIQTHFDGSILGQCTPEKLEFVTHGIRLMKPEKEYEDHPFVVLLRELSDLCMRQYAELNPEDFEGNPSGWVEMIRLKVDAPLNTHQAILETFERALDPTKWEAVSRKQPLAKLPDHIRNIIPSSSPTGTKRPVSTSTEADSEGNRRKKRAPTTFEERLASANHVRSGEGPAPTSHEGLAAHGTGRQASPATSDKAYTKST
ncbi:hypothetical protein ACG7TL_001165 [Trametes sanguinea]